MDAHLREQLRTFHLTGAGLDEYAPAAPLRPSGPAPDRAAQLATLYGAIVAELRRPAREVLQAEARQLHRGLVNVLAADDGHSEQSPEAMAASLGAEASDLFDTGALAVAVRKAVKGPRSLDPPRRARVEKAAAALDAFVRDSAKAPLFWLFHSNPIEGIEALGGRCVTESSTAAALTFCRQIEGDHATLLQAMAVARVELKIARQQDDAAAAAPVILLGDSLDGVSEAVRWSLPLQVLVACRDLEGADWGAIAMAHRTAFVVQEAWPQVERLKTELRQMAAFPGPAVAVVSEPDDGPLFCYDPSRGEGWAQQLEFHSNTPALTGSDAAVASPDWRLHFRMLPESTSKDDQVELAAFLAQWKERAPLVIPYLAVNGGRAAITRELAHRCRERQQARRAVEELAGIGSSFVDAAIARTRTECEAQAAAREQAAHEKGRQEGARQAVSNVVSALLNPKTAAPPLRAQAARAPIVTAAPPSPTVPAAPVKEEPAADAYIDTPLCTSCNDCMKVNPKLFLYNSDKQAYLGDPSAGTFAELVRAAEGCPARCIHPGKPRPGDATATPSVVARAAKLV